MGFIFKDEDNKPVDPKVVRKRAILLSLPFAIMGILALVFLLHDEIGSGFGMKKQMATGLLSVAVVCGGLIALIFGISAKKQALKASAAKSDDEKPWLKRKDWADGRITSSSRKAVLLLWIFVGFWCVASAVISLVVVPPQLHQGNHAALIALIFPVIGLGHDLFCAEHDARVAQIRQEPFLKWPPFPPHPAARSRRDSSQNKIAAATRLAFALELRPPHDHRRSQTIVAREKKSSGRTKNGCAPICRKPV